MEKQPPCNLQAWGGMKSPRSPTPFLTYLPPNSTQQILTNSHRCLGERGEQAKTPHSREDRRAPQVPEPVQPTHGASVLPHHLCRWGAATCTVLFSCGRWHINLPGGVSEGSNVCIPLSPGIVTNVVAISTP